MDDFHEDDKDPEKQEAPEDGKEKMDIEDDEQYKNAQEMFPNLFFNNPQMEIENMPNMQQGNLRFNKFYNSNQFLPLSQNKAHSGLPSDINKIYYKKMITPRVLTDYDKNKPYMKITVMRSNPDSMMGNQTEYILTQQGMIKSEKNTETEDLIIGRHQATSEETKPNDIVLPATDRAISRIHCKIIYKYGFTGPKPIPENFLAFLMMGNIRLGAFSPGKCLPNHLFRLIFQFAKSPKKFYIADIGSVFGTYIRIKPYQIHPIEKGQAYLIGAETLFHITEKITKQVDNSLAISNCNQMEAANQMQIESDKEEFFKYLAYEKKNLVQVHGLDEYEQNTLEMYMNKLNDEIKENINETQNLGKIINRPLLRLDFQSSGNLVSNLSHIFVAANDKPMSDFKIGRAQDCQIIVNHNTISRKQCKLKYFNNDWFIIDGDINKESANGTWISLTDYRVKKERQESDPKEIENETEIKISDSILKIEIKNNDSL